MTAPQSASNKANVKVDLSQLFDSLIKAQKS